MLNYKEAQKASKKSKYRGWIISNIGTYTYRSTQQQVRGKATIKEAKKLTHTHHYYRMIRGIKKLASICAVELHDKSLYIDIESGGLN
jgi:hypothetical protein